MIKSLLGVFMKKIWFLTSALELILFMLAGALVTTYFNWFIQHVFPNIPIISINQGIGILLFVRLFSVIQTKAEDIKKSNEDTLSDSEKTSIRITKIAAFLFCYLIGFIIHNQIY